MDEARLEKALLAILHPKLAAELTSDFAKLRRDTATATLERASPGKFVETFVQCLQFMATGQFDAKPSVDDYLSKRAENEGSLPEGLKLCGARLARTIYTLRNKRHIAHKNPIDPNTFDLALAHEGAAWIMAELLRKRCCGPTFFDGVWWLRVSVLIWRIVLCLGLTIDLSLRGRCDASR
jgi:hypothetical protein